MRRNWIKIYVDQCLRGTMMDEMIDPAERFIWFGFLLLAGDSPIEGCICLAENMGYNDNQLGALLKCDPEIIFSAKEKMIKHGKIEVLENDVIVICKWTRYQSEYSRQKQYRDPHRPESDNPKLQPEVTDESNDTDREGDIDKKEIRLEGDSKEEYSTEFEVFWIEYPKLKGKKVAYTAWKEHPKKNHNELIVAAVNYKLACDSNKTEMEFIKDPSGFIRLAKEYWKDYISCDMPYQVGESRKPKDTPKEKEKKDEYVEARIKKEIELRKKYNYTKIETTKDMDEVDNIILNALATWTKEYYGEGGR